MRPTKYLRYLGLSTLLGTDRTKKILHVNPTVITERSDSCDAVVSVYSFDAETIENFQTKDIQKALNHSKPDKICWVNVDGLKKAVVEEICANYGVHPLLIEDILSINQRAKMDEIEGVLFCLLNMLYFNAEKKTVETEQISIVLGPTFVLSFQEDASRDVFDPIRNKLQIPKSNIRQRTADYLCYAMLDLIVDNYFVVMEKLGEEIEDMEEQVVRGDTKKSLGSLNILRKELIVLKRNITPVRDLVSGIIRSESELLNDRTTKYFKDVYDHIAQAHDLSENYRDVLMSMQDLYINNVNLKMNEVMKVIAIVTCLLAPATVIGGIFGMNFDRIPILHNQYGFTIAVASMLIIPIGMIFVFKKRGWF